VINVVRVSDQIQSGRCLSGGLATEGESAWETALVEAGSRVVVESRVGTEGSGVLGASLSVRGKGRANPRCT